MSDYSLLPVDHAPEFDPEYSAIPVQHTPDFGGADWSKMNQPFGTISASPMPSPTQRLGNAAQDAMIGMGAQPQVARHLADGLSGIAGMTPLGVAGSAADAIDANARGDKMGAAMAMAGMTPGLGPEARATIRESGLIRKLSSTGNVPEAVANLHAALSDHFPNARVSIENAGSGTAFGNSGYVNLFATEPDSNFAARRAEWLQQGKGSGRGLEPVIPNRINLSFRVSDHDVGDRRAAQHVLISPDQDVSSYIDALKSKIPWLGGK